MRAGARATSTSRRYAPERREPEQEAPVGSVVALEELASTLERALDRVKELCEQERAAAAA
jgi:hypothetical protein